MFVVRRLRLRLVAEGRQFSKVSGETSPLIKHLDVNVSPQTALPSAGKSKLRKNLDAQNLPDLTIAQLGTLQSAEEDILETLESCLESNDLLGTFPQFKYPSELVHIKNVKVNRDLSHIDVFWGSDTLERFVHRVYEVHGTNDGKRMGDKIFKNVNLTLQKKEGTFRTFLMRTVEFRRVPR
jgi:hypothetical protein